MMSTRPANHLTLFFLTTFALLGLVLAYWTYTLRDGLLSRNDNPRALIVFNRIRRGRILDRNGQVLAETIGQPGDYQRHYERSAALVAGYASFTYGLSGIEAAANDTLTGLNDFDEFGRWWHYNVLAEPQLGHDVTLTLDLNLQRSAYMALDGQVGAVVILDTQTGEILTMASSPSFDPAQLDTLFKTFTDDSNGPLINRTVLGLYPADDLLSRFPQRPDLSQLQPAFPLAVRPANGGRITPLHAALLVAALDHSGLTPVPQLIKGQAASNNSQPVAVLSTDAALNLQSVFVNSYNATVNSGFKAETMGWYIALRPAEHRVIAVVLEKNDAGHAKGVAEQTWGVSGK